MSLHVLEGLRRAVAVSLLTMSVLWPTGVSAANEGGAGSTGTLVGAVTCGADEITPAANALVSVAALHVNTQTDTGGRFTLSGVPAGQRVRIDAANDRQQSSMSSRFDVVPQPGQTLDIGSIDIAVCPSPGTPAVPATDQEMEERGNPND